MRTSLSTSSTTPNPSSRARAEELSVKECACFSASLILVFIGLVSLGAFIGNKSSGGQKAYTMIGGVFGMCTFMLCLLPIASQQRGKKNHPSVTQAPSELEGGLASALMSYQTAQPPQALPINFTRNPLTNATESTAFTA